MSMVARKLGLRRGGLKLIGDIENERRDRFHKFDIEEFLDRVNDNLTRAKILEEKNGRSDLADKIRNDTFGECMELAGMIESEILPWFESGKVYMYKDGMAIVSKTVDQALQLRVMGLNVLLRNEDLEGAIESTQKMIDRYFGDRMLMGLAVPFVKRSINILELLGEPLLADDMERLRDYKKAEIDLAHECVERLEPFFMDQIADNKAGNEAKEAADFAVQLLKIATRIMSETSSDMLVKGIVILEDAITRYESAGFAEPARLLREISLESTRIELPLLRRRETEEPEPAPNPKHWARYSGGLWL